MLRKRKKRPLTDRIPILYDLKQLTNPFLDRKDYRNRPVEKAYGQGREPRR
jgi:hypothetical protein